MGYDVDKGDREGRRREYGTSESGSDRLSQRISRDSKRHSLVIPIPRSDSDEGVASYSGTVESGSSRGSRGGSTARSSRPCSPSSTTYRARSRRDSDLDSYSRRRDSRRRNGDLSPNSAASTPKQTPSHREGLQRSTVRKYALPAAALAGAGVAVAAVAGRHRGKSPRARSRDPRPRDLPPSAMRAPKQEGSIQRKYREDSSEEDDRPRRREDKRAHFEDERRSSSGRGRERRGRDQPRAQQLDRRARSLSQPRAQNQTPPPKSKSKRNWAKWLALLPFALRAIHEIAQPDGGWEQYHKDDNSKRGSQNPHPRHGRHTDPDHYDNEHIGGRSRRASSSDAVRRKADSKTTGRGGNEQFRQRPRSMCDPSSHRSQHRASYDGTAFSDGESNKKDKAKQNSGSQFRPYYHDFHE